MDIHLVDPLVRILRPFSFRGKARLLNSLCPRKDERVTDVFGYRIKLDLNDFIQRLVYLHAFEWQETATIRSFLKPGDVFVDVGANIGYFTLLAASLVKKTGRVLAFEPSPYASARLAETIATNHISQVTLRVLALGAKSSTLPLYLPSQSGNHSPTMLANEGGAPIAVNVRRLDDCLKECGVENVDFMKVDVEGFEPHVLEGANTFLSQGRIRAILCEFNEVWLQKNGSSKEQLLQILTSYGYQLSGKMSQSSTAIDNLLFVAPKMVSTGRSR